MKSEKRLTLSIKEGVFKLKGQFFQLVYARQRGRKQPFSERFYGSLVFVMFHSNLDEDNKGEAQPKGKIFLGEGEPS